jgi:transposase InsO family protein
MTRQDKRSGSTGEAHGAHKAWPPEVRLQMAQAIVERRVSATTLAESFGIPLNTLQDWAFRYRRDGPSGVLGAGRRGEEGRVENPRRGADSQREAVVSARRQHPEHGTRRIRDELSRFEGIGVSEPTVRRMLHEEGLLEESAERAGKPRVEARQFERAEPNQLWQSDIFTFLLRRHERLYVTAFMDDYSRYLVSLVVAHHQRSTLVLEALARGIAEYGAPREVLTDQGRQYTAWRGQTEFEEELRRQGIRHIKSRPHHPETLGKIERFWKTLWEEFLSRTVFADFGDCQRRIALFVQAYNFRRPHQGIGGLVPADRFFRAAPQVREAIERSVAANAMALAREQPQRKPFYLVGRLGDQDLSIALTGSGVFVKLGTLEQTIPVWKEVDDAAAPSSSRATQETPSQHAEMAAEIGGRRPAGQAALPDGAERALRGGPGDGGDRGRGDLARQLLPAGDAGLERDVAVAPAWSEPGSGGGRPAPADRRVGAEGEAAREAPAAHGAAAAADQETRHEAHAVEDAPGSNQLDAEWARSFAELDESRVAPAFDPDSDWRGRAMSWERKLAGSQAPINDEELHTDAADQRPEPAPLAGGDRGLVRGVERQRCGASAEAVPQPLPGRDAPGTEGIGGGTRTPAAWPPGGAELAAQAARGEREPEARERAAQEAGRDDGPCAGFGTRPADRPADAKPES